MRPEDVDLLRDRAARFWDKVSIGAECWTRDGGTNDRGYGVFYLAGGRRMFAHRASYVLTHGPIPDESVVRHRCDNPPCVNPSHLLIGTQGDNVQDAVDRGRFPSDDAHPTRTRPELVTQGEARSWSKLTEADVRDIRAQAAVGTAKRALARQFGVNEAVVRRIVKREAWSHVA